MEPAPVFRPLLLLALACAAPSALAQPAGTSPRGPVCAANESRFPALIGRPLAEVEAALRAMPGIRTLRSGGPQAPMTMDYREDRATITHVDGRATRIVCG